MGRACVTKAFNPPPRWPEPPREGWAPPEGWRPDGTWGEVPAGWRLWTSDPLPDDDAAPLAESEHLPASGIRIDRTEREYPVAVTLPGVITDLGGPAVDTHGFGPASSRRPRPRLRLALTILVTLLGLAITAATVLLFIRIVDYAHQDLSASAASVSSSVHAPFDAVHTGSHPADEGIATSPGPDRARA